MKQLTFDDILRCETEEHKAYALLKPFLMNVLDENNVEHDALTFEYLNADNSKYSSVSLKSFLVCRIKLRGVTRYISLNCSYKTAVAEIERQGVKTASVKSEEGFIRIPIEAASDISTYADIVALALLDVLEAIPKDFSCCSRYEECSCARHCIHPDKELAFGCYYKKVLRSGRVFYGKNKTI